MSRRHGDERHERRHAHKLIRECLAILKSRRWRVVLIDMCGRSGRYDIKELVSNAAGMVVFTDNVIYIDYRYDMLSTLIHELLHIRFRDKQEGDILRLEKMLMHHLTPDQAHRLLRAMEKVMTVPEPS